jgi:cadmium resistance protein CadD (predicted permease)
MDAKNNTLFGKDNLRWMLIGVAVIIAGIVLMSGGKTQDPNVFDVTEVYSKTRITVAPILIVVGLLIEVYAIMKKSK